MGEAQHVGHDLVVQVHGHVDLVGHGRGEEPFYLGRRLPVPGVDENDVAPGQEFRVRPEQGVYRRDPAARGPECIQPLLEGALYRTDVKYDTLGAKVRQFPHDIRRDGHRRGDGDKLLIQSRPAPVDGVIGFRVADLNLERLALQKTDEPASHLTRSADHECALPAAGGKRSHLVLLLRRKRGPDQRAEQFDADVPVEPDLQCGRTSEFEHLLLPAKIPRAPSRGGLHAPDLRHDRLSLRDHLQQLDVQGGQGLTQILQIIHSTPSSNVTGNTEITSAGPVIRGRTRNRGASTRQHSSTTRGTYISSSLTPP